ncbi:acyl-CoA dehydrogenase family protein [Bacillus wiedmannii]|uniref:acyl-CoA dehydrogenase family protein n=1 Tax=Bacillus wiedmannii TaxID=1890302 RepID=UPI00211D3E87|nr:acyl-CoA dehydrogenase family protein [Bacillus wiedmannii]
MFTPEQKVFRDKLISYMNSEEIRDKLKEVQNNGPEWDGRDIYKLLGKKGLLAPNWAKQYGGLDKSWHEVGILAEELSISGVPEALYILSVLICGNVILMCGTEEQKERYLPALAKGSQYATVLYSEPKSGSDLSSLETRAESDGDNSYLLYGRKVYSMKTHLADYGLCAARTSKNISKYDGLTVFMMPLRQKGVTIKPIPSLSDESLFEVVLDGVQVYDHEIIGSKDDGWSVINRALTVERTGLDYYIRARRWFNLASHHMVENLKYSENSYVEFARLEFKLDCSRYLTYQILEQLECNGAIDESLAAISKWYASELACEIVWKAHSLIGLDAAVTNHKSLLGGLEAAYREAPGLTLSAGTSEMMLESISKFRLNNATLPDKKLF